MDTGSINADRVKVAVYNRIKFELPIIYDYIEMTGGFLDEDTFSIPRAPLTDE